MTSNRWGVATHESSRITHGKNSSNLLRGEKSENFESLKTAVSTVNTGELWVNDVRVRTKDLRTLVGYTEVNLENPLTRTAPHLRGKGTGLPSHQWVG